MILTMKQFMKTGSGRIIIPLIGSILLVFYLVQNENFFLSERHVECSNPTHDLPLSSHQQYDTRNHTHNNWTAIQEQRKQYLDTKCQSLYGYNPSTFSKWENFSFGKVRSGMIFDTTKKIFYCAISKVANTNLKVLMSVNHGGDMTKLQHLIEENWHSMHKGSNLNSYGLGTLEKYKNAQIKTMLRNFTNIIFVRDPFERILSAYRDKLENKFQDKVFEKCAKDIIKKYRKNATSEALKTGKGLKFEEFVKHLIDSVPKNNNVDEHWQLYSRKCKPCQVRYHVIGHVASWEEDTQNFFPPIVTEVAKYIHSEKHPSNRSSFQLYKKYYDTISKTDLKKLYGVYKIDYELFGFKSPLE